MLKLQNLTKTFGTKTIVDNVDLQVKSGEIAILLGSSGVGKSTILRLLNNLETLDSGTVTLNKKQLDLASMHANQTIGMVFQEFNLFEHLSVRENITIALRKVLGKSNISANKIANNLLAKYSLDMQANSSVSDLSGGQKQRLSLARALAMRPKILCMDEPTSALDPVLTSYIAQEITDLAKDGLIVLIATHDISLIERLDCTVHLMEHGKIVESGSMKSVQKTATDYPKISAFLAG
jgi:polar amino acid transport system ATP-binding protein